MTGQEQSTLYEACRFHALYLAKKIAGRASGQFHDDLVEAAMTEVVLHLCLWDTPGSHVYKPERGSPKTWLRWVIRCAMNSHCRKLRQKSDLGSMKTYDDNAHPTRRNHSWLRQWALDLSDEGWTLIQLIVMAPVEIAEELDKILDMDMTTRKARRQIQNCRCLIQDYLKTRLAWPPTLVERVWQEVSECL